MTLVRLLNTSSLPQRAMNSVNSSNKVNIQVVHENKRDKQKVKAFLLYQLAQPRHVESEKQFSQKLHRNIKHLEVVKKILCRKYCEDTDEVFYQQAVVPEGCTAEIIRALHEVIMQGYPGSKKKLYNVRQRYYCPNLDRKEQAFINT